MRALIAAILMLLAGAALAETALAETTGAETVNVLSHGVRAVGCPNDDAPALRAIFTAARPGQVILFPAGHTYCLGSTVAPLDYRATDPAALMLANKADLRIEAEGARFVVAPGAAFSSAVMIAQSRNIVWHGGEIIGNRTGLRANQENVGLTLINLVDFRVSHLRFAGFDTLGAAVAGDWLVRGRLTDLRMDGVGLCFDLAFLHTVHVARVSARGSDGANGPGQTCFSDIHDRAFLGHNRTGIRYDASQNVHVEQLDARHFNTGVAISSGRGWRFDDVSLSQMRGHGGAAALGVYLVRRAEGPFANGAQELADVTIRRGSVRDLSSGAGAYGVLIEGGAGIGRVDIAGVEFGAMSGPAIDARGALAGLQLHLGGNHAGGVPMLSAKTKALVEGRRDERQCGGIAGAGLAACRPVAGGGRR